jgi:YHS domain-containing protein
MLGKKGGNQFTKAKQLGLPPPVVTEETRKKISVHSKAIVWDEQRKKNHSEAMKRAVQENPESYTSSNRGRTKQIEYDGIKFQGQWELDFYKWAKDQGLDPKRPNRSFKYEWKGERYYHPDFYIESQNAYIEVKGYETDRDRAKWDQFPEKLVIIKEQQIKEIRNNVFKGIDV